MRISISTIKAGQVFGILFIPTTNVPQVTKTQFEQSVINWARGYFQEPMSIFTAVEPDLLSMVVVLNINSGHQAPQQDIDI